jgi:hypothetical protein
LDGPMTSRTKCRALYPGFGLDVTSTTMPSTITTIANRPTLGVTVSSVRKRRDVTAEHARDDAGSASGEPMAAETEPLLEEKLRASVDMVSVMLFYTPSNTDTDTNIINVCLRKFIPHNYYMNIEINTYANAFNYNLCRLFIAGLYIAGVFIQYNM